MKKLHGFVLSRDTGRGIPNLIVAAFDCELSRDALAREHEKLGARFWSEVGRRLGSVLTDDKGRFDFGEEALRCHDCELRPNVLIVVFAPEDVQRPERPLAAPPEQRVLYMSSISRSGGPEEALIIRLLESQLERFRVGAPVDDSPGVFASVRYVQSVEQSFAFRDRVKQAFKHRIEAQVVAAKDLRDDAKRRFCKLNALRFVDRDHPQRIEDRKHAIEATKKTVGDGLAKLRPASSDLTLVLTEADLGELGLSASENGTVEGTVSPLRVAEFLARRNGGVDLIANRSPTGTTIPPIDPEIA
jgi:hypothetical protein